MSVEDGAMVDTESDEDLDEESMDKISSSPSIDDGGYTLPSIWPERSSSLTPLSTPTRPSYQSSSPDSSSPFTLTPSHFPISYDLCENDSLSTLKRGFAVELDVSVSLSQKTLAGSEDHHLEGEYLKEANQSEWEWGNEHDSEAFSRNEPPSALCEQTDRLSVRNRHTSQQADNILQDLLLPDNDPLLEQSFQNRTNLETLLSPSSTSSESWQANSDTLSSLDESEERDDESDDISFSDSPRFIDYGWGAECLRETEDIDFEFVYALHTFVATVDGQANATKGDTMVLLDDSNSYWWLVRIVKDSSIGKY